MTATNELLGLSQAEAQALLRQQGPNELPSSRPQSAWGVLSSVVQEPMVVLLIACGVVYLALGEAHESVPLLASVVFLVAIGYVQKSKAESALGALRELSSPRAMVVRDGAAQRIPGREVVPGDILVLREGDRVAADCALIEAQNLKLDESLLTGEALPVEKRGSAGDAPAARLFSGSLVVAGKGTARVLRTGTRTELGKIGESLKARASEPSALEREVRSITWRFGVVGLGFSALIAVLYGVYFHDGGRGLLAGLSTAMSLLPEEFPVVLTLFFALGAWRIAQRGVLTRELRAIETLGSISVLCVDKTGTLTENRMRVQALGDGVKQSWLRELDSEVPERFHEIIEYGVLASHTDAFDPMDRAIREVLESRLAGTEHVHRDWVLLREYPLSPELMAMSCVWKSTSRPYRVVAAKGAPEAIADLCRLDRVRSEEVQAQVKEMSARGLRILAVARARFSGDEPPPRPQAFEFEFVGLLGLEDPLRATVPGSISDCQRAGIRVIMLTGDHAETARNVAGRAGLRHADRVITGPELDQMNDLELRDRIRSTGVFARVVPQHKLRIIHALRADGETVAMTGDGVNDAPALKWADVGISMGKRGTDVAREASDLVLLDDDFSSIVSAIRVGRRIFANITQAMTYIFAVHVPIAGLAILPALLKLPLILLPAHIVFMELIIDPASTLVFEAEAEEPDLMHRPPRGARGSPFGWRRIVRSMFQGAVVLVGCVGALLASRAVGQPEAAVRSVTFASLILGNLALILANRVGRSAGERGTSDAAVDRRRRNPVLPWVLVGALSLLACVQIFPYLREVFKVSVLGLVGWAASLGVAALSWLGALAIRRSVPSVSVTEAGATAP